MNYIICRNFTDAKTGEKYKRGEIKPFNKTRVKEIKKVESEKDIKLIRLVKNSGIKIEEPVIEETEEETTK